MCKEVENESMDELSEDDLILENLINEIMNTTYEEEENKELTLTIVECLEGYEESGITYSVLKDIEFRKREIERLGLELLSITFPNWESWAERHIKSGTFELEELKNDNIKSVLKELTLKLLKFQYNTSLADPIKISDTIEFRELVQEITGERLSIYQIKNKKKEDRNRTEEFFLSEYNRLEKKLNKIKGFYEEIPIYSKEHKRIEEAIIFQVDQRVGRDYDALKIPLDAKEDLMFIFDEAMNNAALKKIISGKKVNQKALLELINMLEKFFIENKGYSSIRSKSCVEEYIKEYKDKTEEEKLSEDKLEAFLLPYYEEILEDSHAKIENLISREEFQNEEDYEKEIEHIVRRERNKLEKYLVKNQVY
jgi:hypothetical protein